MKKVAIFIFLLVSLSGCSSSKLNFTNDTIKIKSSESSSTESEEFTIKLPDKPPMLEEKDTLESIFPLDEYEILTLKDNSEKRILIFIKGKQKYYKSIFFKSINILKVIDLQNGKTEIFYGSI